MKTNDLSLNPPVQIVVNKIPKSPKYILHVGPDWGSLLPYRRRSHRHRIPLCRHRHHRPALAVATTHHYFIAAGGLDKLTLDSLYDDAIRRTNQNASYNPWDQGQMAGAMMPLQTAPDPFYASNAIAAPHNIQMAAMAQQQQAFMFQQQQQQMMMMGPPLPQQGSNPFANLYGPSPHPYGSGVPVQSYNPYSGFI